jgi:hypothetical protein
MARDCGCLSSGLGANSLTVRMSGYPCIPNSDTNVQRGVCSLGKSEICHAILYILAFLSTYEAARNEPSH